MYDSIESNLLKPIHAESSGEIVLLCLLNSKFQAN